MTVQRRKTKEIKWKRRRRSKRRYIHNENEKENTKMNACTKLRR